MIVFLLVTLAARSAFADTVFYDSYNNSLLTTAQVELRKAAGNDFWCVNAFEACSQNEGRRIDGSCNNLQFPYAGAGHAQFDRILGPHFNGINPRLAKDGSELPGPRYVRTRTLSMGRVAGEQFTQLMMLFFVFAATDIAAMSILDTLNYCTVHTTCCAAGSTDPMCFSIPVPADDPVHRFSGIRCLNMTRPISFQSEGCIDSAVTPPHRINYGTPFFDLSCMYGNAEDTSNRQRLFKGGLLNFTTTSTGKQWPQYIPPAVSRRDGIEGLTGVNFLFGLWFWREHNRFAAELAKLNPCWTDEQLFTTAREINIAQYSQIFHYEMLPPLMGYNNLVKDEIISSDSSFRDVYDATILPGEYIESLHTLRWIHLIQEGLLGLYSSNGTKLGEFPEMNFTLSSSLLNANDNIKFYTQGAFRTPTAKSDRIIDPYVAELGLATLQRVSDLTSGDVQKSRLLGIAPYVDFLSHYDGATYANFDALKDYIDEEGRTLLSELYKDVADVDLIVGLWLEYLYNDSAVPKTFYKIVKDQLLRSVRSDRHWYESNARPNAFTKAQLSEIRKASVARVMCNSGDTVVDSGITASPFLVLSDENPIVSCNNIATIDLSPWKDNSCSAKKKNNKLTRA